MKSILAGFCVLLTATASVSGHHSFAAEFDSNNIQTIKGTVTRYEWMNPHVYFYLDARDGSGQVVNWGIQSRNLSILKRQGWTKNTLKPGEQITVVLFHHRDPAKNIGFARFIEKADGTKFDVMPGGRGGIIPPNP